MNIEFNLEGPFVSLGIVEWPESGMKEIYYEKLQVRFNKRLSQLDERDELIRALTDKCNKSDIDSSVYRSLFGASYR